MSDDVKRNGDDEPGSAIYKTHEAADSATYELWGNDTVRADELASTLADEIVSYAFAAAEDRPGLVIALAEALHNAILHGNLGIDSNLKGETFAPFDEEVRRRRRRTDYQSRCVVVTSSFSLSEVRIVIRDQGEGFDPALVADPRDVDLDRLHGRGLAMIRALVDEVLFNDVGNEITLVKRRKWG